MPSHTQSEPPAGKTITLPVEGMSCAACQVYVEQVLRASPGVLDASVNLMTHSARVRLAPSGSAVTLVEAIREAGYESRLPASGRAQAEDIPSHSAQEQARSREEAALGLRAFAALLGGVVLMVASLPTMSGPHTAPASTGSPATLGAMDAFSSSLMHAAERLLPWLFAIPSRALGAAMLLLTLAGMVWAGGSVYRRAWSAARHRTTNMHTLVALGTLAAFLSSAAATLAPGLLLRHGLRPAVYYDSVLLILGFLLLGSWLDTRAKRRTLVALQAFAALRPELATVLRDAAEERIPVGEVVSGDVIIVRPGERLPVDGLVLEGRSSIDESLLTGESMPVLREPGDRVIGGSLNHHGLLRYRATTVGEGSMLGQMLAMMDAAQASKAPMQQLADRASRVFVPVVLGIAALTFIAWTVLAGDPGRALGVAIAVLVIACPCAMGLAVPAALTVAIGRAAQLGVLFKGGEALERLAAVDTVVLDKTGTLTEGKPRITAVLPAAGVDPSHLLEIAASLEHGSEHPLAAAVLAYASMHAIQPATGATDLQARPGRGITGTIEGAPAAAGNAALLRELGIPVPESSANHPGAGTPLHIASVGCYLGTLLAEDTLKPGAAQAIAQLHRMGLRTHMLTGDRVEAAASVAAASGVQACEAALLPGDKRARIAAMQTAGHRVAMVGDGINDAAALAQADAGLAMGTGADLAREAGDAVLLRGEPSEIVKAIQLARHTRAAMRQNLGWALGYNLLGIPLAAGLLYPWLGLLLSPAVASAAMALSSVSVLANSLRLRGYTPSV